jgi:hypothetical protein
MTQYLVERYVSAAQGAAKGDAARLEQLRLLAQRSQVRVLRSIYLPEDETSLILLEAPSVDLVEGLMRQAGVTFDRIAEAAISTFA